MSKQHHYQATHQAILETILDLAKIKPIYKISVAEVMRHLSINRSTFYLHFLDLFDAIESLELQLIQPIVDKLEKYHHHQVSLQDETEERALYTFIAEAFYENFEILQLLYGENGDPNFETYLRQKLDRYVAPEIGKSNDLPLAPDMAREIVISSIYTVLRYWALSASHYQPHEIAEILYISRHLSPFELAGLLEKK